MEKIRWPDGKKCAVMVSYDVDAESIWNNMSRRYKGSEKFLRSISNGKYGPNRCVPRLLDLMRSFGVKGSFYVPGWTAEHYPHVLEDILKDGHEIGHHGYEHETFFGKTIAEQTDYIQRSQEIFKKQTGQVAIGFRSPSSDYDPTSPKLFHSMGFTYSSSMREDDRPYRTIIDGKESDFIEIPLHIEMDDYAYSAFSIMPPEPDGMDRIAGYGTVLDNFIREFEGAYRYGLCFVILIHPQISGAAGKIHYVEKLLEHILSKGDVWVATGAEIADYWRANY